MLKPLLVLMITCLVATATYSEDFKGVKVTPYLGYEKAVHLTNGKVSVVLCPEGGGRVLEYALNGNNALFVSDGEKKWKPGDGPQSSAGRFDIGPELMIPPRPILWSGACSSEINADRHARLTSADDPSTGFVWFAILYLMKKQRSSTALRQSTTFRKSLLNTVIGVARSPWVVASASFHSRRRATFQKAM